MRLTPKRRLLLTELAQLRFHRKTIAECAVALGVSQRTINNWIASPEFKKICAEIQEEWRGQTQGRVAELGNEVISKMHELMNHARSDFVKFHAAKTLGDWLRLGQTDQAEEAKDDRAELLELTKLLAERAAQQPRLPEQYIVRPGGLLPERPAQDIVEGEVVRRD